MLNELKTEANRALTENGAATYLTTESDCLDLFAAVGALRREKDGEIIDRFRRAYAEDPDLAMKILFFARDVRGGLGERRVFRTALRSLAGYAPWSVAKNVERVAEYGRWDDLLTLIGTPSETVALRVIARQLRADVEAMEKGEQVSLLAKWLPSVNASNAETCRLGKYMARSLKMTEAYYRRTLSRLRAHIRILENSLRERDYSFDYEKQPSKALLKYRAAFLRNDGERYQAFLDSVKSGGAKLHTGTLLPYEVIRPLFGMKTITPEETEAVDATWNALEDFTDGENALVVVDGSGSMYGGAEPLPAAVAQSLGIYFAERNEGEFRNHFITFSTNPRLVEIKGGNILEKLRYCVSYNECADTNIQKVFELILDTAVKHNLPQEELPATLYIISDMEFNYCTRDASLTNFEYAKSLYARHGYTLPKVVFWNVASRNRQQPVTMNEQGVALVSGCSPRIFSMLKSGEFSPWACMMGVLGSERYRDIAA